GPRARGAAAAAPRLRARGRAQLRVAALLPVHEPARRLGRRGVVPRVEGLARRLLLDALRARGGRDLGRARARPARRRAAARARRRGGDRRPAALHRRGRPGAASPLPPRGPSPPLVGPGLSSPPPGGPRAAGRRRGIWFTPARAQAPRPPSGGLRGAPPPPRA